MQVECTESFDGGLPQSFLMEVLELPTLRMIANMSTTKTPPNFSADGLEAGASYRVLLYAINAKGRSDATVIDPVTFKGVAKLQGKDTYYRLLIVITDLLHFEICYGTCLIFFSHFFIWF